MFQAKRIPSLSLLQKTLASQCEHSARMLCTNVCLTNKTPAPLRCIVLFIPELVPSPKHFLVQTVSFCFFVGFFQANCAVLLLDVIDRFMIRLLVQSDSEQIVIISCAPRSYTFQKWML